MDPDSVLRYHALYQKSWTGTPRDPLKAPRDIARAPRDQTSSLASQSRTPRVKTSSGSSQSDLSSLEPKKEGLRLKEQKPAQSPEESRSPERIKPKGTSSNSPTPTFHVSMDPLSTRRNQRCTRSRPWTEKVPKAAARSDDFEMVYESFLPKEDGAEYRARKYVTNPRYGQLYEVKREKPRPSPREEKDPDWLWENKFRLWRLEMATPRRQEAAGSQRSGRVSEVSRNEVTTSTSRTSSSNTPDSHKPHADLFAAYHSQSLLNQRRHLAAAVIQQRVRGWLVRKHIRAMKRQALLGLGRGWPKVTSDYRDQLTRIQTRVGVDKPVTPFSLEYMQDYIDRREKYERAFEEIAPDNKLSRDKLREFLEKCGHFPTEGETTAAFNTVFTGAGSTAEVVFVLDCSTSVGERNFGDLMTFVKDVVRVLPVGRDRVRVGLVPYNTDVFQTFGLRQHATTEEILHAIDKIKFRPGVTRTDIALSIMMDIFQDSRPGVQKVAVVVTDGQSAKAERTALEAKKAAEANVTVFAVGVGDNVQTEELQGIAREANRVLKCSSYHALIQLKRFLSSKLCLRACTLCQYILPRVQLHGLYKAEALEIVFTLYKPLSLQHQHHQPQIPSTNPTLYFTLPTTTTTTTTTTRYTPPSNETDQASLFKEDVENGHHHPNLNQSSDSETPKPIFTNADEKPDQEMTSDAAQDDNQKEDDRKTSAASGAVLHSGLEKAEVQVGEKGSQSGLGVCGGGPEEGSEVTPSSLLPSSSLAQSAGGGGGGQKGEEEEEVVMLGTGAPSRYENVIQATDFKVCLGLVVRARLEREGVVTIPSDVRAGVEEVTTYQEAMEKIEAYLAHRRDRAGRDSAL